MSEQKNNGCPIGDFDLARFDRFFGTNHCKKLRCKVTGWPCVEMAASGIKRLQGCGCWSCENWRRWNAEKSKGFSLPLLGIFRTG